MDVRKRQITARDLKVFHPKVVAVVMNLVQHQGVRCRLIDGKHILLYPPDRNTRPFKVSASRPYEGSLRFLGVFCRDNQLEEP